MSFVSFRSTHRFGCLRTCCSLPRRHRALTEIPLQGSASCSSRAGQSSKEGKTRGRGLLYSNSKLPWDRLAPDPLQLSLTNGGSSNHAITKRRGKTTSNRGKRFRSLGAAAAPSSPYSHRQR